MAQYSILFAVIVIAHYSHYRECPPMKTFLIKVIAGYLFDLVTRKVKTEFNFKPEHLTNFAFGKRTTIRLGHKKVKQGAVKILADGKEQAAIKLDVIKSKKIRFGDLNNADAIFDGFNNLSELRAELEDCYKKPISNKTKITQVFFTAAK